MIVLAYAGTNSGLTAVFDIVPSTVSQAYSEMRIEASRLANDSDSMSNAVTGNILWAASYPMEITSSTGVLASQAVLTAPAAAARPVTALATNPVGKRILQGVAGLSAGNTMYSAASRGELTGTDIAHLGASAGAIWALQPVVATEGGTVRVYRVEGTPNSHIIIGEGGTVAIQPNGKTVWLNFGNQARAEAYLSRKIRAGLPDAKVKSFEVPQSVVDDLRTMAVPESMARNFPNRPIISNDPFPDQYGLRPNQIPDLILRIIQGTGKEGF